MKRGIDQRGSKIDQRRPFFLAWQSSDRGHKRGFHKSVLHEDECAVKDFGTRGFRR